MHLYKSSYQHLPEDISMGHHVIYWRKRSRCPCKRSCFVCVAGTLLAVVCLLHSLRMTIYDALKCSDTEAKRELQILCHMYRRGEVVGDLCSPLCDRAQVQFSDCAGFHAQKKVIFMTCGDVCRVGRTVPAVLKTNLKNVTEWHQQPVDRLWAAGDTQAFLDAAQDFVVEQVKRYIGFLPFKPDDAVRIVWGDDMTRHVRHVDAAWRSLTSIMSQSEFVLSRSFRNHDVFPEIYGSCGPYYLQESTPPGPLHWMTPVRESVLGLPRASWLQRATVALHVLKLLQRLDTRLPEPLLMCDIKGDNYGLTEEGGARLLDTDEVVFNSSMSSTKGQKGPCARDTDCTYNHCEGFCDVQKGTCHMDGNYNLQYTCRMVFMGRPPAFLDDGGLLHNPPSASAAELRHVLHECSELSEILRHDPGARQRVMDELIRVLTRSLTLMD